MSDKIEIDEELRERYDDTEQLADIIADMKKTMDQQKCWDLMMAVEQMLENGCFCPDCMASYVVCA
jgi:hypothetical protein